MTGASRFFDAIAGRYDRVYALPLSLSRARMEGVVQALPRAPARVLDLGVGTGRELPVLLDRGYEVTGLDASTAMLERCARRARPIPLVQADFWLPLPFDTATFDAALALHGTLSHAPAIDSMACLARELARVVRPAGCFVAEVPSLAWLDGLGALPPTPDRRVHKLDARTCRFEDTVAHATIDARVLSEDEWIASFSPAWTLEIHPLGELEWLVVGHRSR